MGVVACGAAQSGAARWRAVWCCWHVVELLGDSWVGSGRLVRGRGWAGGGKPAQPRSLTVDLVHQADFSTCEAKRRGRGPQGAAGLVRDYGAGLVETGGTDCVDTGRGGPGFTFCGQGVRWGAWGGLGCVAVGLRVMVWWCGVVWWVSGWGGWMDGVGQGGGVGVGLGLVRVRVWYGLVWVGFVRG